MKYMASLMVVKSIEKSRTLYEGELGLKVVADFGQNITFEGGFSLHEEEHYSSLIDGKRVIKQSNSFELYFEEDEIETYYEKVKQLGLELVHEMREQPWRQLVFRFYDYDKNIIEIGEPMEHVAFRLHKEGLPVEDISRITYSDEDAVKKAIEFYS